MTKPNRLKVGSALVLLCAAIAVTAQAQTFNTLVQFDGADGSEPDMMSLIQGSDGNFYGTTSEGGLQNVGTIFNVTSEGALNTLYSFCAQNGCPGGANGLIMGADGSLYGVTAGGGHAGDCGTAFKLASDGTFTVLLTFRQSNGCTPVAPPIQGVDGNLYGTTTGGGAYFDGTVYKITTKGILTTLHSFNGPEDGALPFGKLVEGTDGNFYGTTLGGGSGCPLSETCGTVFRITPSGTFTNLYVFCLQDGCPDGEEPYDGLALGLDGAFYGTTFSGGSSSHAGTIFRIDGNGTLATLYRFSGYADGSGPIAGLTQATDGSFYGSTLSGGSNEGNGFGTLFRITPSGGFTTLYSFNSTDGSYPYGGLLQSTNGPFLGTTQNGGNLECSDNGCGTIFSLDIGLRPFVAFVRPAGKVGQTGGILGQGFTGTTSIMLNGTPATYTVVSDTFIKATVPPGATAGYVTVTTPTGVLTSNVPFHVLP
jgi:uncharacterized repeat protein (TIGR03803 family)